MPPREKLFAGATARRVGQRVAVNALLESLDGTDDSAERDWAAEIEKRARTVVHGSAELLDYDAVMSELSVLDNE